MSVGIVYGAMVLITLGEAGRWAALQEFLDEQYLSEQEHADLTYDEHQNKKDALWMLPWFLGAVFPTVPLKTTWAQIFLISAIAMAVSSLVFVMGFRCYFIHSHEAQEPSVSEQTRSGNLLRLINILKERRCFLMEALVIWIAFLLASSVVHAAGNTFFYQQMTCSDQMTCLDSPFNNYDPAVYFNLFASLAKYVISFLCGLIPRRRKLLRLRIWFGMACIVLCCLVAWQVKSHRLNASNASIFWLVPQFLLLGIMEGLARYGMIDFLVERVPDRDKVMVGYYGSHTTDLVTGIGKIFVGISILALRGRWFDDNSLDSSHLDKYYMTLTILTAVVFFSLFCLLLPLLYHLEESENKTPSQLTAEMVNQPQPYPSRHSPNNEFTETLDETVGLYDWFRQFTSQMFQG